MPKPCCARAELQSTNEPENRGGNVCCRPRFFCERSSSRRDSDFDGQAATARQLINSIKGLRHVPRLIDRIIAELLLTAQERYPQAKQRLAEIHEQLIEQFGTELTRLYPTESPEKCREVALGVLVLADGAGNARLMGLDSRYVEMARKSAERLIGTIDDGGDNE